MQERTAAPVPAPYLTCDHCGRPYPARAAVDGQKVCPTCTLLAAIDEAVISDRLDDRDIIAAALAMAVDGSDIALDLTAALADLTEEDGHDSEADDRAYLERPTDIDDADIRS